MWEKAREGRARAFNLGMYIHSLVRSMCLYKLRARPPLNGRLRSKVSWRVRIHMGWSASTPKASKIFVSWNKYSPFGTVSRAANCMNSSCLDSLYITPLLLLFIRSGLTCGLTCRGLSRAWFQPTPWPSRFGTSVAGGLGPNWFYSESCR